MYYLYLRKKLGPQIVTHKKKWAPLTAICHICEKPANLANFINPQSCGFAIIGTYSMTACTFGQ
jgi:hypothetical protein